jgi:transcriptional regulator with XRE-family HTH domain
MDANGIGRRIAYWRERRRMTQAEFGTLMGKSRRWVQDIEGGQRQSDPRLSVPEAAAMVLEIPLERLLTDKTDRQCIDASEIRSIRAALQRHDVITGSCGDSTEPPPISVLHRSLVHSRSAFQAGRFAALGAAIPTLLVDATRAASAYVGDEQLEAYRLLSLTLELTEAVGIKYGDIDMAMTAGYRAVAAAERSGDPVVMASSARHLAEAMTHHGQAPAAVEFAITAAHRLHDDLLRSGPTGLSVLGMLWLKAAMAQAAAAEVDERSHAARARAVPELLDEADEHATRLGRDDNLLWTAFGPTNVGLYRVAAHVHLSQGADAVAVAADIPTSAVLNLPRERRAHLLTDLARGYCQAGQRGEAVDALLKAEREAPEEVRCRPRTKQIVEDLRVLGAGSTDGRLRALADRCGLLG